jgi:diguanylate cyclase (GGDEF)-like protein
MLLYEEHDGALCCVAAFGERFAYYGGTLVALDDPVALPAQALRAGHRVALGDDDGDVRPLHPRDGGAVAIPLTLEAGRRCVLAFASQGEIGAEELGRLAELAHLASPAYLIALDREQDRYDAEYDGLTGLLTPRAFRQSLSALVDRMHAVPSTRLGLLFVDTDHFKHWNDRFGHAAGDALLRELANVFRGAVSQRDLVGRNGGDEFCIVFTETGKATAIERAETLRRRIATLDVCALLPAGTNDHTPITASIGVAAYPSDASTASDLLERADAAMYHSKLAGRDGVSYCADGGFVRYDSDSVARPV